MLPGSSLPAPLTRFTPLLLLAMALGLGGCVDGEPGDSTTPVPVESGDSDTGGGDGGTDDTPPGSGDDGSGGVDVSELSVGASSATVQSDDSTSATITATALDADRAALPGIPIAFSATAGKLSSSRVETGTDGTAQVTFSAGTSDPTNTTASITASADGVEDAVIPVTVTGSTVTVADPASPSLVIGGDDTAEITVTAKDAGDVAVQGAEVSLSVSGPGSASLESDSGTTDTNGEFTTEVTGTAQGQVTVTAEALGDSDAVEFTVQAASQALQLTSPSSERKAIAINSDQPVSVSAPGVTTAEFVTSLGSWSGCDEGNGTRICQVTVASNNTASATLSAATAGTATVQVYDADDTDNSDSLTLDIFTETVDPDSSVSLQAESTTVPVSGGSTEYSTALTARVKNGDNNPIGNASVFFSLSNTTGGGEQVSPASVVSGPDGSAQATFTSGTNTTGANGVTVTATLYADDGSPIDDSREIVINRQAGSVAIGRSTEVEVNENDPYYVLPMAVMVSDAAGNPVAGKTVTLRAWPTEYATGSWGAPDNGCPLNRSFHPNEDKDEDLELDDGEDSDGDGELTPPNSAAGSLPSTVTTDTNGVATFDLTYLKASAIWIKDEITATASVSGTETTNTLEMVLPALQQDIDDCNLPDSPYN